MTKESSLERRRDTRRGTSREVFARSRRSETAAAGENSGGEDSGCEMKNRKREEEVWRGGEEEKKRSRGGERSVVVKQIWRAVYECTSLRVSASVFP